MIFPLSYFLAINPLRFSWGFREGLKRRALEPVPTELVERAELIDRYMLFVRDFLTISFVVVLISRQSVPAARVGLGLHGWKGNVEIGIAAGLARVAMISTLNIFVPALRQNSTANYMRMGTTMFWCLSILVGAFAEEFWIAVCLVLFRMTAYPASLSIALTAIIFGAMHFHHRFGGALAIAMTGAISCLLFLWTGSLITTCLFHLLGNLGVLFWARVGGRVAPV